MPANPEYRSKGGDAPGVTKTAPSSMGRTLEVAKASYDPGCECVEETLEAGDVSWADVKQGFASYGRATGNR